jgi:hypothetical protein
MNHVEPRKRHDKDKQMVQTINHVEIDSDNILVGDHSTIERMVGKYVLRVFDLKLDYPTVDAALKAADAIENGFAEAKRIAKEGAK